MRKSRLSWSKQHKLIEHFVAGTTARCAAELIGVNRKTAAYYFQRLRLLIAAQTEQAANEVFAGEIEVDESYFGPRRVRGKRGRGASGKIPVLGLHKRQGRVFLSVVKNCSKAELMPILQGRIVEGSDVYTDGWKAYDGLVTNGYQHHRVHHHENEFARGKNHVNGIESFWSYAKFRMAKLRGVRKEKFLIHLKESEWRFNHRSDNIYSILLTQTRHFPL